MKLSLKLQDHHHHRNPQSHCHNNRQNPLLLRAKLPVTVFGLPFLTGVATTDPADISLSLRTNFPCGPSLQLSYTPTSAAAAAATPPLALTLKSGVSLFGSPQKSPLIISAQFTVSPQSPSPNPIFSLQIKPQFGDFSLRKTTYSSSRNPTPKPDGEVSSMGFVPLEKPLAWKDLTMESPYKYSLLSGIAVTANTELPVMKHVAVNFRWGVNFPADIKKELPFLTVNKIGIERIYRVKESEVKNSEGNVGDLKLLKGLFLSLGKELEVLQKENREIKQSLEELRFQILRGQSDGGVVKKGYPLIENSGEFEQWKSKKSSSEENGRKQTKKNMNRASDVESELPRTMKAA